LFSIIDKPHNLYLGIAFDTGVLSLIAFLVFIGMYLLWSFRLYRRRGGDPEPQGLTYTMGCGIFVGVCGFLVGGLFYDGMISVLPLFLGLLAIGIACNFEVTVHTLVIPRLDPRHSPT
jgi:O-antigen ligase